MGDTPRVQYKYNAMERFATQLFSLETAKSTNTEVAIIKEGLSFETEFHVDQAGFTLLSILGMTLNS